MTRDELVQAGVNAGVWANEGEIESVLDALEPLIRADERGQYQGRRDDMMRALSEELLHVRTKTLADLRAQVEAMFAENLPPYLFRHNKDVLFPKMERTMLNDAIRDVWEQAKENVLALIDGGSDGPA